MGQVRTDRALSVLTNVQGELNDQNPSYSHPHGMLKIATGEPARKERLKLHSAFGDKIDIAIDWCL